MPVWITLSYTIRGYSRI